MPLTQPFNRNQQMQPQEMQSDPFSVFFGTAAEEYANQASLGIFKPDIIPERTEEMYPIARVAGKIAGSIAGFGTSMVYLGWAGKALLGTVSFGRSILVAGKTAEVTGKLLGTAKGASLFRGGVGTIKTGALFAFHDVAEEFINQSKEKDPDAYQLGIAGASGFLQGGVFGFAQRAFTISHPIKQMIAGGTAFTVAEAINTSAYGDRMDKEDYARSFLTGMVFSGISSRGWKTRRIAYQDAAIGRIETYIKNSTDDPALKQITSEIFESAKFGKVKDVNKFFTNATAKLKSLSEKELNTLFYKEGKQWWAQHKEFKMVQELRRDLGITDKAYYGKLESMFGKTTSKELTRAEGREYLEWMRDYAHDYVMEGINVKGMKPFTGFDKTFRPISRAILRNELRPILGKAESASQMIAVEKANMNSAIGTLINLWDESSKVTTKQKFIKGFKNVPIKQQTNLINLLEKADNPKEFALMTKDFNPGQIKAAQGLRRISLYLYERMNQSLKAMGRDPIDYRKDYFPHILKKNIVEEAAISTGQIGETLFMKEQPKRLGKAESPLIQARKETRKIAEMPTEVAAKYETDPRKALEAMVHLDMKSIWLTMPKQIVEGRMKMMVRKGELTRELADDMAWYVNTFAIGIPTESSRKWDAAVHNYLSKGLIGNAAEATLKFFGREMTDRPLSAARSLFGASVSRAFIFARPALALRNMMQTFHIHAYTDTVSLAKAIAMKKPPAQMQKLIDRSPVLKAQMLEAEEGMIAQQNWFDKTMGGLFAKSQVWNVKNAAGAAYYQGIEYVSGRNPYYKKVGIDWSDAAGKELRVIAKKAGTPKWYETLSEGEGKAVLKWMEHISSHTQYLYHVTGMPGVFRSPVGGMAFKLQSFPMNYVFNYLADTGKMLKTGYAGFDTTGKYKVPPGVRLGIFKHFVGLGLAIAAFEKAGVNMRDIVGLSYDPELDRGNPLFNLRPGILNFRPSPAAQLVLNFRDIWSEDEYVRRKAIKSLKYSGTMFVPGYLAGKDIKRAIEGGERRQLFIRKPFESKKKKAAQPSPFESYSRSIKQIAPFGR